MLSVSPIRLLPPYHQGPNLRRIPHPQGVPQLGQHPLEPLRVARGLDPDQRRLRQGAVKRPRFSVLMLQPAMLEGATGDLVGCGEVLIARRGRPIARLSPAERPKKPIDFAALDSLRARQPLSKVSSVRLIRTRY